MRCLDVYLHTIIPAQRITVCVGRSYDITETNIKVGILVDSDSLAIW